ncbi:MAG: dTDP-4-dehydrorhamnose 3,5-epimerase [Thermoflavifilum sp.]|nr:dTDP-4-dehydrorhamnose 3,5-epimerase [Thermoflavifilum sp.]
MPFETTAFEGLFIFTPRIFYDDRGYFFESYNQQLFAQSGYPSAFVQDNQAFSRYGVIRGLHYQRPPHAQSKLIRVLKGKILDVVVDLRPRSATFRRVFAIELSEENKKQLFVPKGFAHGYAVLSETAEVLYKCDAFYHPESEEGLRYNDPDLNIDWKIPVAQQIISQKDQQLPLLQQIPTYDTW